MKTENKPASKFETRRHRANTKLQLLLTTASLLSLLACGAGSDQGSGQFTLATGTYLISNANPVPPDNCNLVDTFQNGRFFGINVSGANVSFGIGGTATISGNSLNQGSETSEVDFNTALPEGQRYDCIVTITATASGSLLANNEAQVTWTYSSMKKAGTAGPGCTTQNLGYKAFPCTSTVQFTATKR